MTNDQKRKQAELTLKKNTGATGAVCAPKPDTTPYPAVPPYGALWARIAQNVKKPPFHNECY